MIAICDGKIALVTGAAAGIGRATAVALARAGARVMASDIVECDRLAHHGRWRRGAQSAGGGGSIVNTASVAGLVGMGHAVTYSAAKSAVIGLTKNAAMEYARNNIRINAVCPGGVRTNMTETADKSLPGFFDKLAKLEPMGRIAEPEEIASAVVWLSSDGASFMTGHALPVDGGYVAR